mmetsp:Transcript_25585/g.37535  ORF Transcript_25585/g.37535 Transcript_25585/m.37535 type:complete len:98 (+) Transcript_25585:82-375(+)
MRCEYKQQKQKQHLKSIISNHLSRFCDSTLPSGICNEATLHLPICLVDLQPWPKTPLISMWRDELLQARSFLPRCIREEAPLPLRICLVVLQPRPGC